MIDKFFREGLGKVKNLRNTLSSSYFMWTEYLKWEFHRCIDINLHVVNFMCILTMAASSSEGCIWPYFILVSQLLQKFCTSLRSYSYLKAVPWLDSYSTMTSLKQQRSPNRILKSEIWDSWEGRNRCWIRCLL